MEHISPKNQGERVAVFRHNIVGALLARQFTHGELRAELERLSHARYRPPQAANTRTYSVPTLERWYYAARSNGTAALVPSPRADKGHGRCLSPEIRELLCDIRREHPSASVALIVHTLITDGRIDGDAQRHASVIRKLFAQRGLRRCSMRVEQADGGKRARLRWEASAPGALWHGDVCHFQIVDGGVKKPVRIHGLLDDASRHIIALEARSTEKEIDMLAVFLDALRRHGPPQGLYLDNGSTYTGEILATACQRINIHLVHAKAYDPEARGKMERFWRTLREGLLDFCTGDMTLADLNTRLGQYLEKRYLDAAHAGLLGRSPRSVYREHKRSDNLTEEKLKAAFTVRARRRVSHDSVVSIDGDDWQLDQGFLAGKTVTIVRSWYDPKAPPAVEVEGKQFALRPVDPVGNGQRKRPEKIEPPSTKRVAFDPAGALRRASQQKGGDR